MSAFLVLVRLRVLDVLRSSASTAFVLLFPLALLLVVGLVFLRGHPFEVRHVATLDPGDPDVARCAAALAEVAEVRVTAARDEAEALGRLRSSMASAVLRAAPGGGVDVLVGPRDTLFGRGLVAALPAAATLRVTEVPRFGYVQYLFPGMLTFSIVLAGLFGMGYTMVHFRQNLFLKKLATTPLPRATFILANIAARLLLVLAQLTLLVLTAWLAFDVRFTPTSLCWLFAISLLGLLAFLGAGFALSCFIRNADVVVDAISAVNLPLTLLSEIFFPLDALPAPLAAVGEVLPSTAMVRLLREVLLHGVDDPARLAPGLLLIAGWAIATFAISLWAFRWHE
jgi:ABC-type multidrug transport system permease subunit